ncbi:pectate lyase superfamily domain protein [TM7 phage DolZOral124_53_65]|nr:pectate lyase superfamily domain protein [TM7 phage DolZOral124_53_65]
MNRKNLANSTLREPLSPSQSEVIINHDGTIRMPQAPFVATVSPDRELSTIDNSEIVRVVNIAGNTLTVERAQGGTTAKNFSAGAVIANGIYAGDFDELMQLIDQKADKDTLTVNVLDYGATPDGSTNSTDAFNAASAAVEANNGGTLVIPDGDYLVGKQTFAGRTGRGFAYRGHDIISIKNCTNPVIIRSHGARIKYVDDLRFGSFHPVSGQPYDPPSLPFYQTDYRAYIGSFINLEKNKKVLVLGALSIDGNRYKHEIGGEYGDTGYQLMAYGVRSIESQHLLISDVESFNHATDGFYVGQRPGFNAFLPTPCVMHNIDGRNNGRQGLSLTGGTDTTISESRFDYNGTGPTGMQPGSGIDIEGERGAIRDVKILNCTIRANQINGVVAQVGDISGVTISNSVLEGTYAQKALSTSIPRLRLEGCSIRGGYLDTYDASARPELATRVDNCYIEDMGADQRPIEVNQAKGIEIHNSTIVSWYRHYSDLSNAKLVNCKLMQKSNGYSTAYSWRAVDSTLIDVQFIEDFFSQFTTPYFIHAPGAKVLGNTSVKSDFGNLRWGSASGPTGVVSSNQSMRVEIRSSTDDTRDSHILSCSGSPEGIIAAPVGSLCMNNSYTTGQGLLYIKTSGSGDTGWVAANVT